MHKRIAVAIATTLFALVAGVAAIVTDLQDHISPLALGAKASVRLDFSETDLSAAEAFAHLGRLSDQLGLDLVKIGPDLSGDQSGQIVVTLGNDGHWPEQIRRFRRETNTDVRSHDALAHAAATGQYVIAGDTAQLAAFQDWLTANRVGQRWSDESLGTTLELLVRQTEFGTTLLAIAALQVALVLYWLAAKARGRAVRVLAGVPAWRIQYEDLAGLFGAIGAAAAGCGGVAVTYVGLAHGAVFVPYFALALLTLMAVSVVTTLATALTLFAASWPSAAMLAARQPVASSLRNGTIALKTVTFVLVLMAVAPAFSAMREAERAAAEQAQWKALADQVVLAFTGLSGDGESGMQAMMPAVGEVVREAEGHGAVALSYTWAASDLTELALGPYTHFAVVSDRWLDLMQADELIPLAAAEVPDGVTEYLSDHMVIWSRRPLSDAAAFSQLAFYRYAAGTQLPLMTHGGQLVFPSDAVIAVVPAVYETFNDSFLISAASSGNLVFTGSEPTLALVAGRGLQDRIEVRHVAEDGILLAQFAAYFAWLRTSALAALVVALAVAAAVGAFITAMLRARRDFALRLAGRSWGNIVGGRVLTEWLAGVALTVLVMLITAAPDSGGWLDGGASVIGSAAAIALLISPLVHGLAARWAFVNVCLRRM